MGLKVGIGDEGTPFCDERGIPLVRDSQGGLVRQTSETVTGVLDATFCNEENKNIGDLAAEYEKRQIALKKYPELADKVHITEDKIIVSTSEGDLVFGYFFQEDLTMVDTESILNSQPFSGNQLRALVSVFGESSQPYIDILGLTEEMILDKEYRDKQGEIWPKGKFTINSYWSNTYYTDLINLRTNEYNYVEALILTQGQVCVSYQYRYDYGSSLVKRV